MMGEDHECDKLFYDIINNNIHDDNDEDKDENHEVMVSL